VISSFLILSVISLGCNTNQSIENLTLSEDAQSTGAKKAFDLFQTVHQQYQSPSHFHEFHLLDGGGFVDSGSVEDGSLMPDMNVFVDAGLSPFIDAAQSLSDSALQQDASWPDVSIPSDSGLSADASQADGGVIDSGSIFLDATVDAGQVPQSSACAVSTSTVSPFYDANPCLGGTPPHARRFGYISTGQAWGDFDNDGWQDLYVTSALGENRLYRNQGNGEFTLSTMSSSVSLSNALSGGAVFVDIDNDGFKDLYVLNYGANTLFRNLGGQGFEDITSTSSIGDIGKGTTAAWGDYDGDGLLDLYVANHGCTECVQPPGVLGARDRLYHNEGNGRFTDVTFTLGYYNTLGRAYAASFLDFDNDGDLDIYVANDGGRPGAYTPGAYINRNTLFRNNGPGCNGWCFVEVGTLVNADARVDGMGLAIADYDNDGDLDIYCTHTGNPVLLENDGTGRFSEVAVQRGAAYYSVSWGAFFFDYDNDADFDLYLAIGLEFWGMPGNRLFQNIGSGQFTDVTVPLGLRQTGDTLGAAYADYDNDGRLDYVIGNWGNSYRLYKNNVPQAGNWIRYRLVGGVGVNRDAVGARVSIALSNGRTLMQEVKIGSSVGSGNDTALHFGLGSSDIQRVEIRWPDGTLEVPQIPAINQEILHFQP